MPSTPHASPQDRAQALLSRINNGLAVPPYVAATALLMASCHVPAAIVTVDYLGATVEYRRALAGARLERRCEICGPGADHTNRAHDDEFDARDRRPDLARIAEDPATPAFVAESARMLFALAGAGGGVVVEADHALALRYDLPCDDCGPEADHTNGAHVDLVAQLAAANEQR